MVISRWEVVRGGQDTMRSEIGEVVISFRSRRPPGLLEKRSGGSLEAAFQRMPLGPFASLHRREQLNLWDRIICGESAVV